MVDTNLSKFGVLVRQARANARLTVRELVARVGISHAYVAILETGRNPKTRRPSKPGPGIVRALASELRLNTDQLLSLTGHKSEGPRS